MKKTMLAIVSAALIVTGAQTAPAAFQPEWLQTYMNGTFRIPGLYHGVGFAEYEGDGPDHDTMRLAKDRALDELCYQLSVSIQSTFEDRVVKAGAYEDQQIASSLFVSTRKVLSGVEDKAKWTDSKKHRHWVLLVIDKDKADQQVEQQKFITEVAERLEHKQDEIQAGISRIATLLNNSMQIYNDRMQRLNDLLKTIDSKVESSGDQVKQEYAAIRSEIMRLQKARQAYENQMAESEQRQDAQLRALMEQNRELKDMIGRLTNSIQKDYFLALADNDTRYKDNDPDFYVSISPDKGQGATYHHGERVRFAIQSSKGCYIKVIYISSEGDANGNGRKINTVLFPNPHDTDNWINPRQTKVIGRLGELEIQPPYGKDVVTVVASPQQFADINHFIGGASRGYVSEVTSDARGSIAMRTRGIRVTQPKGGKTNGNAAESMPAAAATTDTCFIVSQPK
jgi:hypothetical protein